MEKEKKYQNVKFLPNTIRAARELIDEQAQNDETNLTRLTLRIQVSDSEQWTFDSEEEFFAAYRNVISSATYIYQHGLRSLTVRIYMNYTTVDISAPTRAEIEAAFNIFEEAVPSSSLPVSVPVHYSVFPGFELERKLPSCHIDRKLIEHIERFCIQELPKIADTTSDQIRKSYTISIVDSSGTEDMLSIAEYGADRFPDMVSRIVVSTGSVSSPTLYLRLSIQFDRDRLFSRVSISCKSDKPRELAHAIAEGIMQRISPSKTMNYIYHTSLVLDGILSFITIPLLILSVAAFVRDYTVAALIGILSFFSLCIYFIIAKKWNAYTTFDSQLQARRSSLWRWFIYGGMSFVLFSTVLILLRKKILGF